MLSEASSWRHHVGPLMITYLKSSLVCTASGARQDSGAGPLAEGYKESLARRESAVSCAASRALSEVPMAACVVDGVTASASTASPFWKSEGTVRLICFAGPTTHVVLSRSPEKRAAEAEEDDGPPHRAVPPTLRYNPRRVGSARTAFFILMVVITKFVGTHARKGAAVLRGHQKLWARILHSMMNCRLTGL